MMSPSAKVTRIPLEKPASIRRQIPDMDSAGWMISDFVAGPENSAAVHLFQSVSDGKLLDYSPVVLYGDTLTGKTAVAISLAVAWSRHTKLRPLTFATGESFAREFAAAIEIDDLESFRAKYRRCKLLVIDDIDALASKNAAQSELVFTIDALAALQTPVIVTCKKLPASLRGLTAAASSRLTEGLSIRIAKPSLDAIAVICDGLLEDDSSLSSSDIVRICKEVDCELVASDLLAIIKIASQNRNPNGEPDLPLVRVLAEQHLRGMSLTVAKIAKTVAKIMRVKISDMRGSSRQARIVRARGLAILLSRRLTTASLQDIGEFFGGRDHSTILHAYRKTDKLVDEDSELSSHLANARAELIA